MNWSEGLHNNSIELHWEILCGVYGRSLVMRTTGGSEEQVRGHIWRYKRCQKTKENGNKIEKIRTAQYPGRNWRYKRARRGQ